MNTRTTPRNQMTGAVMRGGIYVDEINMNPDANYWQMSAKGALKAIERLLPEDPAHSQALRILDKYWDSFHTWKEICLKTERVRDLIKALCH